ncbi:MAG: hypothetical protein AAB336_09080 [Acidobacteriota bacterium]
MFCPTCGQQQISDDTRFCSRCGLLLSDVAEVIANKGISPYKTPSRLSKKDSPRKRGIKQGGMIMLVGSLLVVPIIAILYPFLQFPNVFIPIAAVISFMGGLLRIIYAWMFESSDELVFEQERANSNLIGGKTTQNALPPQQSIPVTDYASPNWHTTNELVQPPSVTEDTTKLLQKEK